MGALLVTGAAHGIGAATAHRLADRFEKIFVADIDEAGAGSVAEAIEMAGGRAESVLLDVADRSSWRDLRRRVDGGSTPVAAVVNNAFTLTLAAAHELAEEQWENQLSVNLGAVYRSIATFHDQLLSERGSVVNVASVHAIAAWPRHPAYAAAKGGVMALTRQLAVEYAPAIRVNAVVPGSVMTRAWNGTTRDERAGHLTHIPLGRFGTPHDVAGAVAFLLGPDAAYITGTSILVDGGLTSTV
ncbi:NAD(P)-dependent dehydrogenase (short-subunit alcohol dehydrogenase family) [Microbacterium sp. SLBN-154]|nr:NAD(P)-dependent dehydrogenase (short-subunit alcohol dehydrogenase family) [Microbacterium sp. SLBN-154]